MPRHQQNQGNQPAQQNQGNQPQNQAAQQGQQGQGQNQGQQPRQRRANATAALVLTRALGELFEGWIQYKQQTVPPRGVLIVTIGHLLTSALDVGLGITIDTLPLPESGKAIAQEMLDAYTDKIKRVLYEKPEQVLQLTDELKAWFASKMGGAQSPTAAPAPTASANTRAALVAKLNDAQKAAFASWMAWLELSESRRLEYLRHMYTPTLNNDAEARVFSLRWEVAQRDMHEYLSRGLVTYELLSDVLLFVVQSDGTIVHGAAASTVDSTNQDPVRTTIERVEYLRALLGRPLHKIEEALQKVGLFELIHGQKPAIVGRVETWVTDTKTKLQRDAASARAAAERKWNRSR